MIVHTRAFLYILLTYIVHTKALMYIHCTLLGLLVCGDCLRICSFHRSASWWATEPGCWGWHKTDGSWWKIEVCLVHVCTSYHKYRPSMYFVHTQYKPSVLTHRSTQYFFNRTDRYALMYWWKVSCNIWSLGDFIIPQKIVVSPASTYWYILSQINFEMYILGTYQY
jgi:hypothetical protein